MAATCVVAARREGNDLVLSVRDTGVGLSGVANDGTHFGVNQVRERLSTLYGPRPRSCSARPTTVRAARWPPFASP